MTTPKDIDLSHAIVINGKVAYAPTPKQLEYHSRTEPKVLFWGGRGSGKSKCGRWDAHMRALSYPGFKYCILRRTYPELEKSHLIDIGAEMMMLGGYFNKTSHTAHYPNGSIGFFSHCATDVHVHNLLSAEFYLMFFDEVSTFEWDMFSKLAASVRVPEGSGLVASVRAATNPLGASADMINRYWVTHEVPLDENAGYRPDDWYAIHANLEDNPYVDQAQYRKDLEGTGLAEHVRRAWLDGEFGLENALFEFYPNKNNKPYHVIPYVDMDGITKHAQIYRAMDSGFFPDPSYCVWIAHLGHRYIAFHEKLWYRHIASEIAASIKQEDEALGISRVAVTYCDPTMDIKTVQDVQTIKDIYEMNGIAMECSVNNREHFAHAIHTALAEEAEPGIPRLQIYGKGCPYLVKTLPQQRYDLKHPLALADHKDDHGVVSVAYFLISSGSMERRGLATGTGLKRWMQPKQTNRFVLGSDNVRDTSR